MIDHEIIERVSSLSATGDTKFELLRVLSLYQRMFPDPQNFDRLAIWKVTGGDEKKAKRLYYLNKILKEIGFIQIRLEKTQGERGTWRSHVYVRVLV